MLAIKEILPAVFSSLQTPVKMKRALLTDSWPQIIGPQFAPHTKPSLAEGGRLFVRVSQSVLAFELQQKYAPSILKRTQALLGEKEVQSVRFVVGQIR